MQKAIKIIFIVLLIGSISCTYSQERKKVVSDLKKFKNYILSEDKQKLADLFDYPIISEDITYLFNACLNVDIYNKSNKITRKILISNISCIFPNELKLIIKKFEPDLLIKSDTIQFEINLTKDSNCYHYCDVIFIKEQLIISFGTNTKQSHNYDECSEFEYSYTFQYKKGKIKLINIQLAG